MKQYNGFPHLIEVGNKSGKVHVGCTPREDGKFSVSAYATDDNGNKLFPVIGATLVAENERRIDLVEKLVAGRVAEKMADAKKESKNGPIGEDKFSDAFRKLEEYGIENAYPGWGKVMARIAMGYFRLHTLPFLQKYARNGLCDGDLNELESLMREIHLNGPRIKGEEDRAENSINHHKAEADIIYRLMQQMPDVDLPEIDFGVSYKYHIDKEKPKFLPEEIRTKFTSRLEELTVSNPLLAKRVIVFFDCGLRPREAAAIDFDSIQYHHTQTKVKYGLVFVLTQEDPDRSAKKTDRLKSPSAYRTVPLSTWGAENMERACANQPENPEVPIPVSAAELSKEVLNMLTDCGLTSEMLIEYRALMVIEPDCDVNGTASKDVAAYIIRRDRAARWKNICGFAPTDIDIFLGHVPVLVLSTRKSTDAYKSSDLLEKLAELNENYVYNPKMSGHPLCAPIRLSDKKRIVFSPHTGQALVNDTDEEIEVDIYLMAEEPGEPLTIAYSDNGAAEIHQSNTIYNPEKVDKRATIGQLNKEYKEVNNEKSCQ